MGDLLFARPAYAEWAPQGWDSRQMLKAQAANPVVQGVEALPQEVALYVAPNEYGPYGRSTNPYGMFYNDSPVGPYVQLEELHEQQKEALPHEAGHALLSTLPFTPVDDEEVLAWALARGYNPFNLLRSMSSIDPEIIRTYLKQEGR